MLELIAVFGAGCFTGWFLLPQPTWAREAARRLGLIKD